MLNVTEELLSNELCNAYTIAQFEMNKKYSIGVIVGLYVNPLKSSKSDPLYLKESAQAVLLDENENIIKANGLSKINDYSIKDFDFINPVVELKLIKLDKVSDIELYLGQTDESDIQKAKIFITKRDINNKFKLKMK